MNIPKPNSTQVEGSGTTGTVAGSTGWSPARSYWALFSNTTAPLMDVTI
jgi:hypothetical protein